VLRVVIHSRSSNAPLRWHALLFAIAAPFSLASAAFAQDDSNLPNLLFEPVVIDVVEPEENATDAPYTVQELTSLPHASPAVDLQAWLVQHNAVDSLPPAQLAADIARYEQSVLSQENSGGAFDPGLDEELLALGTLLQQSGDYTRAQQVFERALHVNRVNDGLFNMGQVPIIERTIENYLARGDLVAADEQQEYLLYVQRRNFGSRSVDLLPALTRYAEWNLFAFGARLVAPPPPANADEAVEASERPELDPETMINFRTGRLITAQQVYQSIIQIVTNNFGLGDNRLQNFERQLALTNYLYIATVGLDGEIDPSSMMPGNPYISPFGNAIEAGRPPLGFRQGRDSLERRVAYFAERTDVAPVEKARAKMDLADWMLLFSKRTGSIEVYEEAWQDLSNAGTQAAELDAVFNPTFPIRIPEYVDHAYTRKSLDVPEDLSLEYKGYIDVEFKLSRFGIPSGAKVRNKSLSATPQLESILLRDIRRAQFRPRIAADGSVRDTETMHVRFYFTY
jgi:tetratricopeptide (TPR) repeat protein